MDDITALADEHLERARRDPHGRSAHLFLRDGPLRQTLIALVAAAELEEHNAPPAAGLHVLHGRVRLSWRGGEQELRSGQAERIPQDRHALTALEDSAVVLTTVTGIER